MVNVYIKTDSHYKINRDRVRKTVIDFLSEKKIKADVEVNISVVGDRMMKKLNHDYRKIDETTDVLSFSIASDLKTAFVDPPDGMLRLGDIIISYPQMLEDASDEDKLTDVKFDELVLHGLNHLLGIHHPEL